MDAVVTRRKFTAAEFERMAEAGILHEDEPVELIAGDIVYMCAIGSGHAGCVNGLNLSFAAALMGRAIVSVQNPVRLGDDMEPEPDIALLKPRSDLYRRSHPTPEDILLIVEVADTSLPYDHDIKLPMYAVAGIPELWIVNLKTRQVEVYRRPKDGHYEEMRTADLTGTLSPAAFPDIVLRVADIIGDDEEASELP